MKSIAKLMINAINPKITDEKRKARLECRKKMFALLEECTDDFEERCAIVENLFTCLKFDCEYETLEDGVIEEYKTGIYELIDDISTGKETALGDICIRLKKMLPEGDEE